MRFTVERKRLEESLVPPRTTRVVDGDTLLVDFGRAVYGTLVVPAAAGAGSLVVHLGEKLGDDGRLDREPGATIRYRRIEQAFEGDGGPCRIVIPPDRRNTNSEVGAILMPEEVGEVMPFRYADPEDVCPGLAGEGTWKRIA